MISSKTHIINYIRALCCRVVCIITLASLLVSANVISGLLDYLKVDGIELTENLEKESEEKKEIEDDQTDKMFMVMSQFFFRVIASERSSAGHVIVQGFHPLEIPTPPPERE